MPSKLLTRRDLDFLLFEWLRVDRLTDRARFADHSVDTFAGVLDLCEALATRYFANHFKKGDCVEPAFDGRTVTVLPEVKEAFDAVVQADLVAASADQQYGGAQLPAAIATAGFMWMQAGSVGTVGYFSMSMANANLLATYGDTEQKERFLRPILSGRFTGTMCLSEPHAGSSLADIFTRAEPSEDGTYRLFGSKMWISCGDHEMSENIVHLVLAKIPGGPPGAKGISLFVVPKFLVNPDGTLGDRNDIVTTGLNHKMGQRSQTNVALGLGDGSHTPGGAPGAVGYIVGAPHQGLAQMFHMMNEARLIVGAQATALGYTGYLRSLAYAQDRPQGRPLTAKDATAKPVAIIEHPDVKRMLLAQKSYVEGALALILYCSRLVDIAKSPESDDESQSATELLDLLTPIAKSWPSQWCLEANNLAIQVHGGYGYTREYDAEQLYRDNRLNAIHEGTQGIQSIDLLGRRVRQNNGAGLRRLEQAVADAVRSGRAMEGETAQFAIALESALSQLLEVTGCLVNADDVEAALANSAIYLEAFGHIVIAWMWLEQLLVASGKSDAFYEGKRHAARYFYRYELPKTGPQLDLLRSLDRTTLDAVFS